MRVLVHDFSGHPFQAQLSRELARRGHHVVHTFCAQLTTGQGALAPTPDDPPTITFEAISIGRRFERYQPFKRIRDELAYGRALRQAIQRWSPEVVLSSNAPILVEPIAYRSATARQSRYVIWLQDLLSIGTRKELSRRLGLIGRLLASPLEMIESAVLRKAHAIVSITEGFDEQLKTWSVDLERRRVIPNWAPLAEIPICGRSNQWAQAQGTLGRFTYLYSGTLGLKHNPDRLLALAKAVEELNGLVVVVSEGLGADYLRARRDALQLTNLVIEPFQAYEMLPHVLGAADVLVALLEQDAGAFSVPSKVLTYHCAGKPILAAIPSENLAADIIRSTGSGLCVEPADEQGFLDAALHILHDKHDALAMGNRARAYAEINFDPERIVDQFESVLKVDQS